MTYDIPGMQIASSATMSDARFESIIRASRYVGTAASVMTTTFMYLIAAYAVWVEWIAQNGASR